MKPYVQAEGFLVDSILQALKRALVFDIEVQVDLSLGIDVGIDVTVAGFALAVGIHGSRDAGDLSLQALVETPAFGGSLDIGLTWTGEHQRQFEANITGAFEALMFGDDLAGLAIGDEVQGGGTPHVIKELDK